MQPGAEPKCVGGLGFRVQGLGSGGFRVQFRGCRDQWIVGLRKVVQ